MPYEFVDWMKCKDCGDTACLFIKRFTRGKLYLTRQCKQCYLEDVRDLHAKNSKKRNAANKEYKIKNRDKIRKYMHKYNKKYYLRKLKFEGSLR